MLLTKKKIGFLPYYANYNLHMHMIIKQVASVSNLKDTVPIADLLDGSRGIVLPPR